MGDRADYCGSCYRLLTPHTVRRNFRCTTCGEPGAECETCLAQAHLRGFPPETECARCGIERELEL